MNIFFNSRINANQSLLNVLFGQQQKAASSQNTGCRGTSGISYVNASCTTMTQMTLDYLVPFGIIVG